jgi:hypothetical protein
MGDYALVKGENEEVVGVWVKNEHLINNSMGLQMLAIKHQLKDDVAIKLASGKYRIVPNSVDNNGGYFLMLGNYPAPGEKKTWWKIW